MYDDFEKITLDAYKKGNLYGLEKYWYYLVLITASMCRFKVIAAILLSINVVGMHNLQ
jgi:hypothetical protein